MTRHNAGYSSDRNYRSDRQGDPFGEAARPVPAADEDREPCCFDGLETFLRCPKHGAGVSPSTGDDRERPDPVADMQAFLAWLFRDGDDVQEALAELLRRHGCDHRAGVSPSTGDDRLPDPHRLTDAMNKVLRKQPRVFDGGFVYGETGAAVVREYAALATPAPKPEEPA